MYSGVPWIRSAGSPLSRARPKSMTFTSPVRLRRMLFGLAEELQLLRVVDRNDLEGVVLAVGAAADVQDRAVGAGPQRSEDLKVADAKLAHEWDSRMKRNALQRL